MEALTEFVILVNEKTGEFSTFLATAQKAGLVEARSGNKKLTVFAPADTTFADIDL
ncbi:MAG: fasciclin domain-containing protein [Planctomycetes bacterium]|nr:fasciclin domain-containing protein [Planctomycetota bacterium]